LNDNAIILQILHSKKKYKRSQSKRLLHLYRRVKDLESDLTMETETLDETVRKYYNIF